MYVISAIIFKKMVREAVTVSNEFLGARDKKNIFFVLKIHMY